MLCPPAARPLLAGYMDVVGRLLACGSDLHVRNSKGWCAVHSAASNGYFEVVLRLVQVGGVGGWVGRARG